MASKRMIARKVALSKKLSVVKWHTESLYYRGLAFLDDAGRMTADPEEYRAIVIPMGKNGKAVLLATIEASILELYHVGLIGLCECPGKKCMEVRKFDDFNTVRSDRTPQIDCPEPQGMTWYDSDIPVQPSRAPGGLKLKETKGNKSSASQDAHLSPDFVAWWQAWPEKKDKIKAAKQYSRCLKGGYTPEQLLSAARCYVAECRESDTYLKYPATFLGRDKPFADYIEKAKEQAAESQRAKEATARRDAEIANRKPAPPRANHPDPEGAAKIRAAARQIAEGKTT